MTSLPVPSPADRFTFGRWTIGRPANDPVLKRRAAAFRADRTALEDADPEAVGAPGYGFVALNQLALEHLLGAG